VRGRAGRVSDRAVGIILGIVLGIAVILLFLFLGSRNTIDEPSLSGNATQTQTQTQPSAPPAKVSKPNPK
jgi:ABC-type Mn2+/Zn2+ transport system permease subunit